LGHLIVNLGILLVQCVQLMLLVIFAFDFKSSGNYFALFSLMYLQMMAGMSCGFLIAIAGDSFRSSFSMINLSAIITFFLSGEFFYDYRFTPKTAHVSTIRIFNLECSKSQALNDFLQTISNSTHWVAFRAKPSLYNFLRTLLQAYLI
jgi:ABC-type polysaccharide/polyol phosphate export permease